MKTILVRPPLEKRCPQCNSTYELFPEDITAHIGNKDMGTGAWAFRQLHGQFPKILKYSWECPVCNGVEDHYHWDSDAPCEWVQAAIERSGHTNEEVRAINKEIESRPGVTHFPSLKSDWLEYKQAAERYVASSWFHRFFHSPPYRSQGAYEYMAANGEIDPILRLYDKH